MLTVADTGGSSDRDRPQLAETGLGARRLWGRVRYPNWRCNVGGQSSDWTSGLAASHAWLRVDPNHSTVQIELSDTGSLATPAFPTNSLRIG